MRSIIYESDNNDFQIIDLKKEYRGFIKAMNLKKVINNE